MNCGCESNIKLKRTYLVVTLCNQRKRHAVCGAPLDLVLEFMTTETTTYDGVPIAGEPPYGASIIVYRDGGGEIEFLLLHRAHSGPDYEGDWAWTPPAGARQPGEGIHECARRELLEEIGLELPLHQTEIGTNNWRVYAAKLDDGREIRLDEEHDRFEWVDVTQVSRCKPERVAAHILAFHDILRA